MCSRLLLRVKLAWRWSEMKRWLCSRSGVTYVYSALTCRIVQLIVSCHKEGPPHTPCLYQGIVAQLVSGANRRQTLPLSLRRGPPNSHPSTKKGYQEAKPCVVAHSAYSSTAATESLRHQPLTRKRPQHLQRGFKIINILGVVESAVQSDPWVSSNRPRQAMALTTTGEQKQRSMLRSGASASSSHR